jgi:hypothetical protein
LECPILYNPACFALMACLQAAAQGDAFEVLPSDLSAELADRLGALALSGRLSHLLAPWKPWWANPAAADISLNASGQRVVAELHTDSSSAVATTAAQASTNGSSKNAQQSAASTSNALRLDSEGFASLPDPPEQPLQSLVQLAGPRFRPSPLLPYELLQLLVAYCAVMHYWNGEPDCGGNSGSWSSSDRGWEAAEQLMLLAPPLEQQATRIASSRKMQQAQQLSTMEQDKDTASSPQQQQQQSVLAVADSVRCACMQLADAAAALHSELRALLHQATADALALLQLGRAAVLLALTDSCRLLDQGRRNLKQQQQQRHRSHLQANVAGKHSDGTSSMYSLQQSSQQQVQLEQQLKLACRKLVFFQVWCNEQGPAVFEQLSQLLAVELRERQAITTPPAAAGVKLGVQPVELSRQQQHQQQQQQQRRAAHVVQEAVEAPPCEDAKGPALRAANGQQQQQQQQRHGFQEQASTQATGSCIQCGGKQHQQQEQQQQQVRSHISAGGGSAPISDLYELD